MHAAEDRIAVLEMTAAAAVSQEAETAEETTAADAEYRKMTAAVTAKEEEYLPCLPLEETLTATPVDATCRRTKNPHRDA